MATISFLFACRGDEHGACIFPPPHTHTHTHTHTWKSTATHEPKCIMVSRHGLFYQFCEVHGLPNHLFKPPLATCKNLGSKYYGDRFNSFISPSRWNVAIVGWRIFIWNFFLKKNPKNEQIPGSYSFRLVAIFIFFQFCEVSGLEIFSANFVFGHFSTME